MKKYPISVQGDSYKGSKAHLIEKAQNSWRVATKIQRFINDDLKDKADDSVYQYFSYSVADEIDEEYELVRMLIMGVDGGSNGITIWKGDYEKAMQS